VRPPGRSKRAYIILNLLPRDGDDYMEHNKSACWTFLGKYEVAGQLELRVENAEVLWDAWKEDNGPAGLVLHRQR